MGQKGIRAYTQRGWKFIWDDDSVLSWIVNLILAFIIIKFVVYPGLGLMFGTNYPIVAVVSGSMEHRYAYDQWWDQNQNFYANYNIAKQDFDTFIFRNGFNKGDIIILLGAKAQDIKIGDVIVFRYQLPDPIIHRVIKKTLYTDKYYYQTKGDNNGGSGPYEENIAQEQIVGKAVFRIPYLGYIKIWAFDLFDIVVKTVGGK